MYIYICIHVYIRKHSSLSPEHSLREQKISTVRPTLSHYKYIYTNTHTWHAQSRREHGISAVRPTLVRCKHIHTYRYIYINIYMDTSRTTLFTELSFHRVVSQTLFTELQLLSQSCTHVRSSAISHTSHTNISNFLFQLSTSGSLTSRATLHKVICVSRVVPPHTNHSHPRTHDRPLTLIFDSPRVQASHPEKRFTKLYARVEYCHHPQTTHTHTHTTHFSH